jgi:hypothetical protein
VASATGAAVKTPIGGRSASAGTESVSAWNRGAHSAPVAARIDGAATASAGCAGT